MKINTKTIKALNPCKDRFDNWLYYYEHRTFTLRSFCELNHIRHRDKVWVILRLVSNETKVIFALDCSFAAYAAYADAAYAAYADAYADAYAVDADARKIEESRQLESLIYLIEGDS